jgi:hypothetical protein
VLSQGKTGWKSVDVTRFSVWGERDEKRGHVASRGQVSLLSLDSNRSNPVGWVIVLFLLQSHVQTL